MVTDSELEYEKMQHHAMFHGASRRVHTLECHTDMRMVENYTGSCLSKRNFTTVFSIVLVSDGAAVDLCFVPSG